MITKLDTRVGGRAMMVVLALVALLGAWFGYSRPDIVRWFGAFLMCG